MDNLYKNWKFLADAWTDPKHEWYEKIGQNFGAEWGPIPEEFADLAHQIKNSDSVLEIGCGGGRFTRFLLEKTEHVTVSDVVPEMIKIVQDLYPGIKSYLIEDFHWKFSDDFFDVIASFDTFVHIEALDIFYYLKEMHRVLKRGGFAIFHTSNTLSESGFIKWHKEWDGDKHLLGEKTFFQFSVMTKELLEKIILEYDFTIQCLKKYGRDLIVVIEKK